eukprot:9179745-Alexandrium_andersonii.AAC.1
MRRVPRGRFGHGWGSLLARISRISGGIQHPRPPKALAGSVILPQKGLCTFWQISAVRGAVRRFKAFSTSGG